MLREAEVGDERTPVGGEEDVLGLEVPVDDAALVRLAEGGREGLPELEGRRRSERSPREPRAERPARDERHDEVGPRGRVARVDEGHETLGLGERGEEPPLAVEPLARRGVEPREHLDRHVAALGRARAEDGPHASLSEREEVAVLPEVHRPEDGTACPPGKENGAARGGRSVHWGGTTMMRGDARGEHPSKESAGSPRGGAPRAQLIVICRGFAWSRFGRTTLRTPSSSLASIREASTVPGSVRLREKLPVQRSVRRK